MTTAGDSCIGDSGSALIRRKNGQNIAIGIVSFGWASCGERDLPGAYTKVKFFRDQITEWAPDAKWCEF